MAEIMFSLDCVSVCAQQTGQSDSMVLNANSSKTVKTIRTSNFTYEFPGSVRTWCPKILAKGHDQGHWPSKLKKNHLVEIFTLTSSSWFYTCIHVFWKIWMKTCTWAGVLFWTQCIARPFMCT